MNNDSMNDTMGLSLSEESKNQLVKKYRLNRMQEQVAEFHKAFGVPVNETPRVIDRERRLLRAKLILEEASETISAMGCYVNREHNIEYSCVNQEFEKLEEIADGLADLLYVTFGACLEFGIDAQKVFDEVHRSNMSKAWTGEELSTDAFVEGYESRPIRSINGYAVKRSDGKIIKSPSYSPADIAGVLKKLKGE